MTLLLDTHVLLWALLDPTRLSAAAADSIADPEHDVRISAVVAWEVAIQQSLGKLGLPGPAESWLPAACAATGFEWLPVSPEEALRVRALPWHHRDPFDRLLVAQVHGDRVLVTHDDRLKPYGVPLLLA